MSTLVPFVALYFAVGALICFVTAIGTGFGLWTPANPQFFGPEGAENLFRVVVILLLDKIATKKGQA